MESPVATVNAFDTVFATPVDGSITYTADPMHFPAPISPLFASVVGPAFEYGFTTAAQVLHAPIAYARVIVVNHYFYNAFVPLMPSSAEEAQEMGARAEAAMHHVLPRMMTIWENESLPRLKANNARIAEMDIERAAAITIPGLLDELMEIGKQNWKIHFTTVMPVLIAQQLFDETYGDLFGGESGDSHALAVGVTSESVKAGIGLSDLAGAAKAAGLADFLLNTPADRVMDELPHVAMGTYYAAAIRDYLREYGLRQDLFDLTVPTWQEDPSIAISNVQAYLRSGHDAREEHQQSIAGSLQARKTAREKLESYPEAVRGQFEMLVDAARASYFLQEEHNFYIDQQSLALTRLLFVKLGQRFVDVGLLDDREDIFMLDLDDVKAACFDLDAGERPNLRPLATERRASMNRSKALTPPPFLGAAPAGPPPTDNPMGRSIVNFFGAPPAPADHPNQLRGNAGSRGVVTGVARVARTLDEAKALQPGEVLVAITTMPAWTPLFGTAAALVTDTGGALSHAAIVAREYGLPAVVGAAGATGKIRTGQLVTVDGTHGIVTIEQA